jgi:hypothetical protein
MRNDLAFLLAEQLAFLLEAGDEALNTRGEILERDGIGIAPGRDDRRLV